MFLNMTQTPKIVPKLAKKNSPEGPKKVKKRPQMWLNQKQKDRVVFPKSKFIVYIGRSQKAFEPDPNPKNSTEGPKKCKKAELKKKIGLYFQNKH